MTRSRYRYYVDIPNPTLDGSMINLDSFATRKEAEAYCELVLGAHKGKLDLISKVDDGELD